MGIELECGSCGERLGVDAGDGIVICPHCQTALQIPPSPDSPQQSSEESPATVAMQPPPTNSQANFDNAVAAESIPDEKATFPGLPIGDDDLPTEQFPALGESAGNDEPPIDPTEVMSSLDAVRDFNVSVAVDASQDDEADAVVEPVKRPASTDTESAETAGPTTRPPETADGVPRYLFILLLGYASAVTIALIWLWIMRGRVHPLESLPDIAPKNAYLVPENEPLAPGHTLRLGETRRFGNVKVTALRVTRGLAVLVNHSEETEEETLGETLKLHLRLRNVSRDQTFAPIGRQLLLTRSKDGKRANNFVYHAGETSKDSFRLLPFPLKIEETSVEFQGQKLGRKLNPAEELETYIATDDNDDNIDKLTGDLVWRVHLRKGLNPRSGHGVTTLIEFTFHSSEILRDSPSG